MEVAGARQTRLRFDDTGQVTVIRRARMLPGRGERSIHVARLGGVTWREPTPVSLGWIGFTGPGIEPVRARPGFALHAAREDPWCVLIARRHLDEFRQVRQRIEAARAAAAAR